MLNWIITILLQTYSLKYSNKAFLVQFFFFFFFFVQFFAFRQILRCWLQISQPFLSIFNLKISKRTILVSNFTIFIFARSLFKLTTENYTNKAFLVPKLKLFVLHDLPSHKIEDANFKYKNFFKILIWQYREKKIFCPKFIDSYLCTESCVLTNLSVLISNMVIIFQTYGSELQKQDIFGSRFEKNFFCIKYCLMTYSKLLNMPGYAWRITCLNKPEFSIWLNLPK